MVIPTTIDTNVHKPKPELRNKKKLTIGWSGSISTVKHFELVVPVLIKLQERFKNTLHFKIIGDKNYHHPALQNEAIAWSETTEVDELNSFDIGIMPLPDDEWANGKCGLKGLSYMACGIPTVMSGVGVNKTIVQSGINGFLANTNEEWFSCLSSLIEDKALRDKIGQAGLETLKEKYSVEVNKKLYLQIFNHAQSSR